jgi:hypothetical protein
MKAWDSSSLNFWEVIAAIGFWAVFIGVAGEGVEIVAKVLFKKWFKNHEFKLDIIAGACWIILCIGLASENLGDTHVWVIADRQNEDSRAKVKVAEAKAEEAKTQTAIANQKAQEATERTAELDKEITDEKSRLAKIEPVNLPIKTIIADLSFIVSGSDFDAKAAFQDVTVSDCPPLVIEDVDGKKLGELKCVKIHPMPFVNGSAEAFSLEFLASDVDADPPSLTGDLPMFFPIGITPAWIKGRSVADIDKVPGMLKDGRLFNATCKLVFNGSMDRFFEYPISTSASSAFCVFLRGGGPMISNIRYNLNDLDKQ